MKKFGYILIMVLWLCFGGYFGSAGYVSTKNDELYAQALTEPVDSTLVVLDGLEVFARNDTEVKAIKTEALLAEIYPWIYDFPEIVILLITVGAMGVFGAFSFLMKRIVLDHKKLIELKVNAIPIFGFLMGIMVFGISYGLQIEIIETGGDYLLSTNMFVAFFAGLFHEKFFDAIKKLFSKLLSKKEEHA